MINFMDEMKLLEKSGRGELTPENLKLVEEDLKLLSRGVNEIISLEDLAVKLINSKKTGRKLKIKLGIDPTAPHVHLGFAVVLRKLRQFQDLGHTVQLLIGDFTARIGDPTGRSETRKMLTPEEIAENARTYRQQLSIILDSEKTNVRFNSEWLSPLTFENLIEITSKFTVARILERDDFNNRYEQGMPIGLHEFLYPIMQGYDSVALESDVEMGGTDQKFNILVGRNLQKDYGIEPQVVFLMPILEGTDGVKKMSKSYGNYIGITEPAEEMFGKVMSIPDELITRYFELCTDVPLEEIAGIKQDMDNQRVNPRDVKMKLAQEIIKIYHNEEAARRGKEHFLTVFSRKEIPDDIPSLKLVDKLDEDGKIFIDKLVTLTGFAGSKREARRLIEQGAVKIDGEKLPDSRMKLKVENGMVLQVGSRKFMELQAWGFNYK
ncbi:MAG: tyrosine--tRNA ligase [Vulcanimicrobiota bacterium]